MHCCPSTSTCCDRENKGQKTSRLISGHWMQTARTECVNGNALRSQDAKILFAVKDDCYADINKKEARMRRDEPAAAASDQPPPRRSPFCTSLLLWGRTSPRRFLVRTELSGREEAARQCQIHATRRRRGQSERRPKYVRRDQPCTDGDADFSVS